MKPDQDFDVSMELEPEVEPSDVFVDLGILVIEGRTPQSTTPRGYGEGPHCPPPPPTFSHPTPASAHHHKMAPHTCDPQATQCVQQENFRKHMLLLWKNSIPMSIEVLLCPDCCLHSANSSTGSGSGTGNGGASSGGVGGGGSMSMSSPMPSTVGPEPSFVLLEQWTVQMLPKRAPDSNITTRSLFQAVRSYLHFSQLSAWFSLTKGKSPKNVFYRVCVPGEVFSNKFVEPPDEHVFPVANAGWNNVVKVSVKALPRRSSIPRVSCLLHVSSSSTSASTSSSSASTSGTLSAALAPPTSFESPTLSPSSMASPVVHRKSSLPSGFAGGVRGVGGTPMGDPTSSTSGSPSSSADFLLGDSLLDPPQLLEMYSKRYQSPSRSGSPVMETPEHWMFGGGRRVGRRSGSRHAPSTAGSSSGGSNCEGQRRKSVTAADTGSSSSGERRGRPWQRKADEGCPSSSSSCLLMGKGRRPSKRLEEREEMEGESMATTTAAMMDKKKSLMMSSHLRNSSFYNLTPEETVEFLHSIRHPQEGRRCRVGRAEERMKTKKSERRGCACRKGKAAMDDEVHDEDDGEEDGVVNDGPVMDISAPEGRKLHLTANKNDHDHYIFHPQRPQLANKFASFGHLPPSPLLYDSSSASNRTCQFSFSSSSTSLSITPNSKESSTFGSSSSSIVQEDLGGGTTPGSFTPHVGGTTSGSSRRRKTRSGGGGGNGVENGLAEVTSMNEENGTRSLVDGDGNGPEVDGRVLQGESQEEEEEEEDGVGGKVCYVGGGANGFGCWLRKEVPSASDKAKFRRSLDSAASLVFHTRTGLPLTSSPAPMRKGTRFDFDSSLTTVSAIKNAFFEKEGEEEEEVLRGRQLSTSAPSSVNNSLLGNFEESVLNGRLEPVSTVEGFTAEIGASGSFCPRHVVLPVTVFFYSISDADKVSTPYLGHINLGRKGYHVPKSGTIQVTLFNPHGTVVKMFVVVYDLRSMPSRCQTFLRQRTLYMPVGANDEDPDAQKWLRYLIHLRFASSKSGRIYLHTDMRIVIFRKSDMDAATIHGQATYELRSFTRGPSQPKFSPRTG